MLRWMCDVIKMNITRNHGITETTKVGEIYKKVQEITLKWYGHAMRRGMKKVWRKSDEFGCGWDKRKTEFKRRWMDSVNVDLREKGLSREEKQSRAVWRPLVRNIKPT